MGTGSTIVGKPRGSATASLTYQHRLEPAAVLAGPTATLKELGGVGSRVTANRLYAGDNINILRALCSDKAVKGKVRLVYIDPPYATGFAFESATVGRAYSDDRVGADYLEALRQRVIVLRELLADDGTMYLHLDATMIFHAKIVMDEIFGSKQFLNLITRVKCNPKNQARRHYGDVCDYLLFYSKGRNYVWNQQTLPWDEQAGAKEYNCVDESTGRRYKKVPCHLPGVRNGATGTPWRGKLPPPGKHWIHSPAKLEEMDAKGEIYWSPTGNPRRKLYLDEAAGKRPANLWTAFRDTQNQNARITGYPTEKNLEMMELIVKSSSNPGDLVLDAYAGSGSTLAAAAENGRHWIGIDESPVAIKTTIERLVLGTPTMGSHARNDYVKRDAEDTRQLAAHSFRVLVDTQNKALNDTVKIIVKKKPLVAAFKPVDG
jgi:adenine-specific DNA-methyltransferase